MSDFFERFSKVPASQKILLLLLLVAAIFMGFYMLVYNELEGEIVAARQQQEQLNSELARLAGLRERATELEERVNVQLEAQVGMTYDHLPTSDDIPNLLDELHRTAELIGSSPRGNELEIREVRPRPHVPEAEYTRIPLELSLTGTYDQILAFCWELSRMSRIVHVRQLDMRLAGARQAPGPPLLRVSLSIDAFFRPES